MYYYSTEAVVRFSVKKKGVLRNSAKFPGKHLHWSLDSGTGIFP